MNLTTTNLSIAPPQVHPKMCMNVKLNHFTYTTFSNKISVKPEKE